MTDHPGLANQRGFTLIEIMVALIIFAVLSITLLVRLGDNIRAEQLLQSKELAGVIAENTLADLRIKEEWSAVSSGSKTIEFAGSKWHVKLTVSETANENLRRVQVQVGPEVQGSRDDNFVISLATYIGCY